MDSLEGTPFQRTSLFRTVMAVLAQHLDNSSFPSSAASSESSWGEESRLFAIISVGVVFAILTSVGNLMVMVSFKIDKQLQTISNYFLFSLAVADITIGIFSIPFMTYYIARRSWGIGYTMCQFWLCIDYLMSNASVLNLLLISFDRYFSVTRPLTYRPRRTTRRALLMISLTYIISLILWPPWIILWPYIEGKFTVEPGSCVVQFLETNPWVTLGTAFAAFYIPVTIMIILYTRVYCETQKRQKELGRLQASNMAGRRDTNNAASSTPTARSGTLVKRKQAFGLFRRRSLRRLSWLKACAGKSENSSEESSEIVAANVDDTSLASSLCTSRRGRHSSPPNSPLPAGEESEVSAGRTNGASNGAAGLGRGGSGRFRTRVTDRPLVGSTYTVLIELRDGEGQRPSVRLSSCDSDALSAQIHESPSTEEAKPRRSKSDAHETADETKRLSTGRAIEPVLTRNGRASKALAKDESGRKSEKERRKNERKQESKAAKTLSAILFAFIATWTPYNLIVCWEAFFPHSIPDVLFTISYCLCYINSTINPICYALCNARFRHTYKRILRCRWQTERSNLNRHAFLRR